MKRTLDGKLVVVTRARTQAKSLVELIEQAGGRALLFPVIETRVTTDATMLQRFDEALHHIASFDRILITSVNGADAFRQRLAHHRIPISLLDGIAIETVGPKTKRALVEYGFTPEPLPLVYQAEGMLEAMKPKLGASERILIVRSELARDYLPDELSKLGHKVTVIDAYETVLSHDGEAKAIAMMLVHGEIDVVTFTSSSTVHHYIKLLTHAFSLYDERHHIHELLAKVDIACIGPITAQTVRDYGLHVTYMAKEATIESMVNAIITDRTL